ncbi:MAG: DoxX family membrane protein [Candidatus Coatesbacteria bacterium]|nr:DoxX family membrane protein [Candidatus Coatesbacteria bacterium]
MSDRSAMQTLKLIFWNKITALIFRIIVGGVFVYASIDKIIHPAQFADMVYNYRMLPYFVINFFAVILPWIELVIGLCLILGPFSDAASLVTGGLLAMFIVASIAALIRGLDINCGCFTMSPEGKKAGWSVIITNTVLISMLAQSFFFDLRRKRPREEGE